MLHYAVLPYHKALVAATEGILEVPVPIEAGGTIKSCRLILKAGAGNGSGPAIFDVRVNGASVFAPRTDLCWKRAQR